MHFYLRFSSCLSPKTNLLQPKLGRLGSFKRLVESKIISKSDRSLSTRPQEENAQSLFLTGRSGSTADNLEDLEDILGGISNALVKGKSMPSLR